MKSVNLKITLEVVNPLENNYEDIEKYVNDTLLERLHAEYETGQIETYRMLVEKYVD